MGKFRINRCQELETEFRSGTWEKRIYLERLFSISSYRAPLRVNTAYICIYMYMHAYTYIDIYADMHLCIQYYEGTSRVNPTVLLSTNYKNKTEPQGTS